MCNKQCGALPLKPTYAEVTDRINALGYALSILSENRVAKPNNKVSPVDKAIDDIAKELSSLTSQD